MDDFDRTQEFDVDDMVKTIPVICSWCNKIYHIKQWTVDSGKQTGVSHGMCSECQKKQEEKLNEMLCKEKKEGMDEQGQ
ncbi:MAG: hypothetical protein JW808_00295 [Victivallales bacterium]|nr:hypothetical protein [Victivallales bacterium]